VLDEDGNARLFGYSIRAGGTIRVESAPDTGVAASEIATLWSAAGGVMWATTAYVDGSDKVRLINWQAWTGHQ
jgi:hypothetical protein